MDSLDALLARDKWTGNKVAGVVTSVPSGLNAPHVRFVFVDEMGNGNSPARPRPAIKSPQTDLICGWTICDEGAKMVIGLQPR
jgi:hypothetical protein